MKKIIFLLMIIILSLTGFGCAKSQSLPLNSFYFEMQLTGEGQVAQTLAFPTFSLELQEKYSEKQVEKYEQDLVSAIYNEVFSKFYLKYWIKYIDSGRTLQTDETISFTRPHVEENRVLFSIKYSDMDAWRFFNTESSGEEEVTAEENARMDFVTRVETASYFPYSQTNSAGESVASIYCKLVNQTIKKYFPQEECAKYDYCFEYRYITPYSRIRSNADETLIEERGWVHSWRVNSGEIGREKIIKIWASNINAGNWYLVALIVTLGVFALALLIYFIVRRREKKGMNIGNQSAPK